MLDAPLLRGTPNQRAVYDDMEGCEEIVPEDIYRKYRDDQRFGEDTTITFGQKRCTDD